MALIILAIIEAILLKPSKIDNEKYQTERELEHRDDAKDVAASTLAIISVFMYQGIMFYSQMVLSNYIFEFDSVTKTYKTQPIKGNQMTWLVIVTGCFYTYMLSAMTYILIR